MKKIENYEKIFFKIIIIVIKLHVAKTEDSM